MKLQQILIWTTALLAVGASAQTLKPGVWEISNQMQGAAGGQMASAMAQMQKQLESMSPEQRQKMEEMMAKQGMQLGAASGGGMAVKVCMTKEMVERNEIAPQQGNCTHTSSPRTGNTMNFSFVCTKPPSHGDGQITFISPEAYATKLHAIATIRGKEETMDIQTSGKWQGSDCGNIKPLAPPKP